ncbi:MAG TPA: DUF47 family protein [Usitatibacteraceae bacterium]|nr:DUF47 family protein [Usitatibacteraceae bacterium]
MFGRLMPKEARFYELFDRHADQVVRAGRELAALMGDFDNRLEYAKRIDEAEHAADRVTAETVRLLRTTFITPIDRDDIHRLITSLDDICDIIQDVAEAITLYDIRRVTPEAERLALIAQKCCERVKDLVGLLGQEGHTEAVIKTCQEIDRLESDADREMRAAISRLFREEQDVREVVKLKAIYEQLETVTDRCEDVANVAEGIVLEQS